jgi:hypothetical protein
MLISFLEQIYNLLRSINGEKRSPKLEQNLKRAWNQTQTALQYTYNGDVQALAARA